MAQLRDLLQQVFTIWKEEKVKPFTENKLATLITKDLKDSFETLLQNIEANPFIVDASAGKGTWADVPWVAILHPKITRTTQRGIYPVFLFCGDGSGVYLSLCQGMQKIQEGKSIKLQTQEIEQNQERVLKTVPEVLTWGSSEISLRANSKRPKAYEKGNIAAKFYSCDAIPDDEFLLKDLFELLSYYERLAEPEVAASNLPFSRLIYSQNNQTELPTKLENSAYSVLEDSPMVKTQVVPLPKPFILLAGISGTGKTRFVKQQAEPFGELSRNFCLVPVRPDWHEPSDIFGYWSRLNASAGREYVATKTLSFLVKAWADIVLSVGANNINFDEQKNAVVVTGAEQMIKSAQPFWLCFDEMNLAPVEQYLADYLSVLEMRCWMNIDDDYQYESPTLLDAEVFSTGDTAKLRTELGLHSSDYDQVWQLLGEFGLALPYNLLVAGTVNMDETTHQFSRKVLDRAMSIDFEAFYPVNFDSVFSPSAQPVTFTYPTVSHITDKNQLSTVSVDAEGQLTTQFITAINTVLDGTAFKLAYRAYNELLISLHSFNPQTLPELAAVWDDFVMYKVLPRLEGDVDKLLTVQGNNLLEALHSVLTSQFEHLSTNNQRADLFSAATTLVALRSCNKVTTMNKRLLLSGATSFWL